MNRRLLYATGIVLATIPAPVFMAVAQETASSSNDPNIIEAVLTALFGIWNAEGGKIFIALVFISAFIYKKWDWISAKWESQNRKRETAEQHEAAEEERLNTKLDQLMSEREADYKRQIAALGEEVRGLVSELRAAQAEVHKCHADRASERETTARMDERLKFAIERIDWMKTELALVQQKNRSTQERVEGQGNAIGLIQEKINETPIGG